MVWLQMMVKTYLTWLSGEERYILLRGLLHKRPSDYRHNPCQSYFLFLQVHTTLGIPLTNLSFPSPADLPGSTPPPHAPFKPETFNSAGHFIFYEQLHVAVSTNLIDRLSKTNKDNKVRYTHAGENNQ